MKKTVLSIIKLSWVYGLACGLFILGLLKTLTASPSTLIVSYLAVILLATPSLLAVLRTEIKRGIILLLILFLLAWIIEYVGLTTGFPYGEFWYGESMGYKLFGVLPVLVPFGYVPLVLGAWYVAQHFRNWKAYAVYLLTLIGIDLALDPAAVFDGVWTYASGSYYGVPVTNYLGWLLTSSIAYVILKCSGIKELPKYTSWSVLWITAFWCGVLTGAGLWIPLMFGLIVLVFVGRQQAQLA